MEIVELKKLLESPINNLLRGLVSEIKQLAKNRILEYQTNEYKRNLFAKTLIHRSIPVKLEEFYIPLHIHKYELMMQYSDIKKRISTEDVSKLFETTNYITIIGSAGSGKSTLMKYLFIDSINKKFKIPIKVELRYLNEKSSLIKYIFEDIFLFHQLGFTNEIIDRILSSGAFVFFFDGYDEISHSKKEYITNEIDQFVNKYSSNKYVITSRPYTNIETLPLFYNYSICDLEKNEISAFINKQIPKEEKELSEKIEKAVLDLKQSSYGKFLKNPLLLSMFILTYQSYSEVPQKSCEFYKQLFDTLYSTHDSFSKLSFVREKQSKLSKDQFEEILKLFSFISYFEEKFYFKPDYMESKLNFIKEKKSLAFDNQKLIEDLKIAIGILNQEGTDYVFPHRSLQEYFAAIYIKELIDSLKKDILKKISHNIENSPMYIINNENFLKLLKELDYKSVIKYIFEPLFSKMIQDAKDIRQKEVQNKYKILCYIHLIGTHLMPTEFFGVAFYDFILKNVIKTSIAIKNIIDATNIKFVNNSEISSYVNQMDVDDINDIFSIFKESGEKWIAEIMEIISNQEKGDFDIINLV